MGIKHCKKLASQTMSFWILHNQYMYASLADILVLISIEFKSTLKKLNMYFFRPDYFYLTLHVDKKKNFGNELFI